MNVVGRLVVPTVAVITAYMLYLNDAPAVATALVVLTLLGLMIRAAATRSLRFYLERTIFALVLGGITMNQAGVSSPGTVTAALYPSWIILVIAAAGVLAIERKWVVTVGTSFAAIGVFIAVQVLIAHVNDRYDLASNASTSLSGFAIAAGLFALAFATTLTICLPVESVPTPEPKPGEGAKDKPDRAARPIVVDADPEPASSFKKTARRP